VPHVKTEGNFSGAMTQNKIALAMPICRPEAEERPQSDPHLLRGSFAEFLGQLDTWFAGSTTGHVTTANCLPTPL
jgi:hypothetical protein